MGIISRLAARSAIDDYWYEPVGAGFAAQTGVQVNADTAMRMSAVYACVKVLAEGVASIPLITYERRPDGGKRRAVQHPVYDLLHDQPNHWQTSFEWREMKMGHLALRGNAYSEMVGGQRGFVDELRPLHPDRVKVYIRTDGSIYYSHQERDLTQRTIEADRMFHLRGLSSNGITGMPVLDLARDAIGFGLAAEGYGARLFSQDARPGGIIKYPGQLSKQAKKRVRDTWAEAHAGLEGAHKTAVLDEGMEWQSVGMTSEQAQFLATRNFEIRDIARWFRVQPHLIGDLADATFSNIEMQSLEHVIYTLLPWYRRWEQRIKADLILDPRVFAEFLVEGLLRGNIKDRYEAYAIAIQWGILNSNEVRILENRNPREGGDTFLQQMNMVPTMKANQQTAALAREAVGRTLRREMEALSRLAKRNAADDGDWRDAVAGFYAEHADFVAQALCIPRDQAERYTKRQCDLVLDQGIGVVETFEEASSAMLMSLVLGQDEEAEYAATTA